MKKARVRQTAKEGPTRQESQSGLAVQARYLTVAGASAYTGMKVKTLANLRSLGKGPRYIKPTPRFVLYDRADLDAYMAGKGVATSE